MPNLHPVETPRRLHNHDLTEAQQAARAKIVKRLHEIHDQEGPYDPEGMERLHGLSERSVLLLADRGTGKSSLMLSLMKDLPSKLEPVRPLLDIRSFDRTDRVLITALHRLQRAHERLGGQPDDVRRWLDVMRTALRVDDRYGDFVRATSATENELTTLFLRQAQGTDNLRDQIATQVDKLRAAVSGRPTFVFFLDDLDLSHGRVVEAILDIDRYLSVPGLAFVFAAREQTLLSEVLADLQRTPGDPEGLWWDEAMALLAKYFPLDARARMDRLSPQERLQFKVEGERIVRFFERAPEELDPLEGATNKASTMATFPDLLPDTPRGLRAWARAVPASEPDPNDNWRHALTIFADAARERGEVFVVRALQDAQVMLGDREGGRERASQLLLEVVGLPVLEALPESRVLYERTSWSSELLPLEFLGQAKLRAGPRWIEALLDLAMRLDGRATLNVARMVHVDEALRGCRVGIPPIEDPQPWQVPWLETQDASPHVSLQSFLTWSIRARPDDRRPLFPPGVRLLIGYCMNIQKRIKAIKLSQHTYNGKLSNQINLLASTHVLALLGAARGGFVAWEGEPWLGMTMMALSFSPRGDSARPTPGWLFRCGTRFAVHPELDALVENPSATFGRLR